MKKIFSFLTIVISLFVNIVPASCFAESQDSSNETITLSSSDFAELKAKLESLDRQLNPTITDNILKLLKQTTKTAAYYVVIAAIAAYGANKAGYINIPKTRYELKNIKLDKKTAAYSALGLLSSIIIGPLGSLLGFSDVAFAACPAILSALSLYRTDADPISQGFDKVEYAAGLVNSASNAVNSVSNTVSTATNAVSNAASSVCNSIANVFSAPVNWVRSWCY